MAHPIHHANQNGFFGHLTREEFYTQHHVQHQESFMLNSRNMKIFTRSWFPDDSSARLRGIVAIIHGYATETSALIELTAIAMAKLSFFVCALDLQGHGYSEGLRGHIPDIEPVVDDCVQFFDSVRSNHPKLPAFLYGESLGGAIGILICLRQKSKWNGLVLNGAMCGVSSRMTLWPLGKLLPLAAYLVPTWRVLFTSSLEKISYKEEWIRKLIRKSPNWPGNTQPSMATAQEFLRICKEVDRRCHQLETPMLVVHGESDLICDCSSARLVYDKASSKDKTLKIFPGMWHQCIGEPKEGVDLAFGIIFSWIQDRADKVLDISN